MSQVQEEQRLHSKTCLKKTSCKIEWGKEIERDKEGQKGRGNGAEEGKGKGRERIRNTELCDCMFQGSVC